MRYLASKTEKVLQTITQFQNKNGYSPSITELKTIIGNKSTRGIVLQLDKLQKLGYIQREKNSRRAIRILNKPTKVNEETMINVPVIGEIKAGYNAHAEQNVEGYKKISLLLAKGQRDVFILRVKGTSMVKAGINPGDLAIIARQNIANNGDIVVAFDPDDETATLKRFKRLQDYVMLLPESDDPAHQPKIGKQFLIQGKFVDLLKKS